MSIVTAIDRERDPSRAGIEALDISAAWCLALGVGSIARSVRTGQPPDRARPSRTEDAGPMGVRAPSQRQLKVRADRVERGMILIEGAGAGRKGGWIRSATP